MKAKEKAVEEYEGKYINLNNEIQKQQGEIRQKQNEIDDLKIKLKEIGIHKDKIQQLEKLIAIKADEIENLKKANKQLEIDWQDCKQKADKIKEYEEKIIGLTKECQKLTALYNEGSEQIKEHTLELAQKDQVLIEIQGMVDMKDEEIQNWKEKYTQLDQTNSQFQGKIVRVNETERRLGDAQQEILKLTSLLQQRSDDSEKWKAKVVELSQKEKKIIELEEQMTGKLKEIGALQEKVSKTEAMYNELKIKDNSGKIAILSQEIEKLNFIIKQKNDDLSLWKGRGEILAEKEKKIAQLELQNSARLKELET